jgi:hypothetical protein
MHEGIVKTQEYATVCIVIVVVQITVLLLLLCFQECSFTGLSSFKVSVCFVQEYSIVDHTWLQSLSFCHSY